ncbi:MAG: phage terminase large subunit family protein, partial [Desulfuromonadaceae bacterium]|nr:phage terminase large subunit family protein [Desulfuromonadaceae bacterium]
ERRVFRKRTRLAGPQWMERNIHVPIGSRQGLYRNNNNPAMYGILDWSTRPFVRVTVLGKGIQIGGTLGFYGLLLREGEYTSDNALIVVADERTLKKLIKKRLQKMIDQSPTLATIKSTNPDDTTMYSITLGHGFTIDGAWASSETSVSSESYRVVILDEISKYKTRGNIEDAKARATVFPDTHKIWILSSPGIDTDDPDNRDPLTKEAEACDVMMEFHAICPTCGVEQVMTFDRFKWPGQATLSGDIEANIKAIRRNRSAWYECEHCSARWNDYQRDKAVLAAMHTGWKSTDGCDIEQPRSLYFHYPSWLSPYVSISDVVADWFEAQGDEEKLGKWHNRHGGIAHRVNAIAAPELSSLESRTEAYSAEVPMDAGILTAGVDVQLDRLEIEVVGWGLGNESWGIENAVLYGDPRLPDVWKQLDAFLLRRWRHESGESIGLGRVFIDSGYCTSHVYKFTAPRKARGVYAVKGASGHDAPEILGPTKQRIGAIKAEVFILGGNKLKTTMFSYLASEQPGAGYCHFPETYDKEWFEQIQTEHQVAKRIGGKPAQVWEKKKGNLRNEAVDKRQYALAALMSMRINIKGLIESLKAAAEAQKAPQQTAGNHRFSPRGGFVKGWRR